jgi:hypothetical protein
MDPSIFEHMRTARGALHTVSVPGGSTVVQLVPASTNRGSLTFFGAALQYEVGLISSVTTDGGIIVPIRSVTPVVLTLATHGDLVQQCFYVHAAASIQITWAEAIFQGG